MQVSSRRLAKDRRGQGQSEYGLVIAFIGVFLVAVVYFIGMRNQEAMTRTSDKIGSAGQSEGTTGSGDF